MGEYIRTGARRAVHALVHSLGAARVLLQMPALPVADDDGEELGLRSPQFQLKPIAPAAVRRSSTSAEALVPADVLERELGVSGEGAVKAAIASVSTVQTSDELYVLSSVEAVMAGGSACLYRLLLQQPATEVV